ncbi:MAG: phosphoribosylamine--glycine ligase [SAR202 cluster bacterium]|jgi:phosphoribosylamine--glycine ligase|nr:phosphoribosylamine--glycine ligase [SAR202 cluster bacterium]MDP6665014.1 phosphoribosylamine--glycine ligase [SAR202 cluster bacterium]
MKVLVIGNGAREHAITWKLAQSPQSPELFVAPGNAGVAQIAENVPISAEDIPALLAYARDSFIDFTVVGPEAPLAGGIVDRFEEAGLMAFGPRQNAARIESSKAFAKQIMKTAGVPTAEARAFDMLNEASGFVAENEPPFVVKADGLAAGKGVVMAETREDALTALRSMMEEKTFGASGETVLIEEWLKGPEVSVFAFVDGEYVSTMTTACDYKRAGDGDSGLNTGGMGSFSPPPFWNESLEQQAREKIMEPVAKELARSGSLYRGVLYAGLMLTASGLKVIEFNCRLGDPETQVVLPRLQSDLLEIMLATANGELARTAVEWGPTAHVGVVLASGGYPEQYRIGFPISGMDDIDESTVLFHAGTSHGDGGVLTSGGRVLTVTASGASIEKARANAYANASRIRFQDRYYRTDIAKGI